MLACGGERDGDGVQMEGGAGARGEAPAGGSGGGAPAGGSGGGTPRLSRNELKMFHKQILSRNEAWFVKIRRQMTTEKKFLRQQFVADDSVRLCI